MSIRAADVYKGTALAATLRRVDGGTRFAYLDDYAGPDVATTLRRTAGRVVVAGAAVPPYFAGLLPEGRRLSAVRRAIKASADDELTLLAAVGADTIGDVSVVPEGSALEAVDPVVVVRDGRLDRSFASLLADAQPFDRVGLPGVQEKISGRTISYPTAGAGADYILKLNPPEFPHVVENERFFIALARACGLPAVDAQIVHDADGESGLLVTRFDRMHTSAAVVRRGVEDACQADGVWPADKYSLGAEHAAGGLIRNCAAGSVAARALFRQFVFASLTGNGDLHGKNLAMVRSDGEWEISPAYDVPSTLFYGDDTLALEVDGSDAPLSRRRARHLADALGLPVRAGDRVVDELLTRLGGLPADIESGALPFPDELNGRVARSLAYRHRQLRG